MVDEKKIALTPAYQLAALSEAKSGQPISLMDLADAVHREKKPSVLEKLTDQPQKPQRKSKPRKSKEQEI